MKKLMIAAAIVCAAVVSQAAATQWSFTSLTPDADAKGPAYSAYLMDAATLSLTDAISKIESGDLSFVSSALASGTTQAQGTAGNARLNVITTGDIFTADKSYTLYTVVLNDGADSTYAYVTAGHTEVAPPTGYLQSGAFGNLSTGDYKGAWHTVPEPTSGLLLLLGVAGLALRRRRA